MLVLSDRLIDAITERLNRAAPRGVKIRLVLIEPDRIDVRVRRRWKRRSCGGQVATENAREALIEAIDMAAQDVSHLRGRPWPGRAPKDNEPHLAVDDDNIRIWFGEARWPLLTLDPIPLGRLQA